MHSGCRRKDPYLHSSRLCHRWRDTNRCRRHRHSHGWYQMLHVPFRCYQSQRSVLRQHNKKYRLVCPIATWDMGVPKSQFCQKNPRHRSISSWIIPARDLQQQKPRYHLLVRQMHKYLRQILYIRRIPFHPKYRSATPRLNHHQMSRNKAGRHPDPCRDYLHG